MTPLPKYIEDFAKQLADYLESYDSGVPLLSAVTIASRPYLLWQYKKDDYLLDFQCEAPYIPENPLFSLVREVKLGFCSLFDALSFIRLVESTRQTANYPVIQLGMMPGLSL